jgi:putative FmdB family regulatory protein
MPIYEYHCGACGHEVEALQKISDSPLRKCPECGKQSLRRVVSAVSFRLKGAGWYETDFKKDSEKKRNLVETAGKEAGESTASAETGAGKESSKDPSKDGPVADKAAKPAESEKKEPSRKTVAVRAASKPVAVKARSRAPKKPASASRRKSARA